MTTTKIIDKNIVAELLNKAVEAKGADYVDPASINDSRSCSYVTFDGQPSCIVGHVLHYLDVDLSDFHTAGSVDMIIDIPRDYENELTGQPGTLRTGHGKPVDIEFTPEAFLILTKAQEEQDGGAKWGPAVELALEESA